MSITPLEVAMHHLRADDDDSADVQRKLDAAEEIAAQYMGRTIYEDADALSVGIEQAGEQINAMLSVGGGHIDLDNSHAYHDALMQKRGVVMNPAIEAGVLLILGTLYAHREDVTVGFSATELPIAATHRLQPYRIMGV